MIASQSASCGSRYRGPVAGPLGDLSDRGLTAEPDRSGSLSQMLGKASHLKKGFLQLKYSVCIVGGCGHIGLPLGIALAEAGFRVTLLDTDESRVRKVAAGCMPFLERGAEELLAIRLASGRLRATT